MSARTRIALTAAVAALGLLAAAAPASADQVALDDAQADWNPACGAGCSMAAPFDIKRVTVAAVRSAWVRSARDERSFLRWRHARHSAEGASGQRVAERTPCPARFQSRPWQKWLTSARRKQ